MPKRHDTMRGMTSYYTRESPMKYLQELKNVNFFVITRPFSEAIMEPEILKYRLKKNYNSILKDLEPRKLLGYLYQEGIFDEDDMDEVRDERTRKKQAEALLSMLGRRPVQAYVILVDALSEAQPHLAKLLQTPISGETRGNVPENNHLRHYEDIMEMMQRLHCNPTENDVNAPAQTTGYISRSFDGRMDSSAYCQATLSQNCTDFVKPTKMELISQLYGPLKFESVYRMTSSPKGLAVIINIDSIDTDLQSDEKLVRRDGSKVDENSLIDLFTALDFKIQSLVDLVEDELLKALEKISKSDFGSYDCFILCIMSHGKEGYFYTRDGKKITIKTVVQKFNNVHCKTLSGKPKLYFIQACREELSDTGTIVRDGPSGNPTKREELQKPPKNPQLNLDWKPPKGRSISEHADQLVAFSSDEGYIRNLVEVFRDYACVEDVESMMTRVINKVNSQGGLGSKQVPKPETTLTRKVFFWPGEKFD